MARDLATLHNLLWEQFEKAVQRQKDYSDTAYVSSSTPTNLSVLNRQAIGQLGNALALVEIELEARAEKTTGAIKKRIGNDT